MFAFLALKPSRVDLESHNFSTQPSDKLQNRHKVPKARPGEDVDPRPCTRLDRDESICGPELLKGPCIPRSPFPHASSRHFTRSSTATKQQTGRPIRGPQAQYRGSKISDHGTSVRRNPTARTCGVEGEGESDRGSLELEFDLHLLLGQREGAYCN